PARRGRAEGLVCVLGRQCPRGVGECDGVSRRIGEYRSRRRAVDNGEEGISREPIEQGVPETAYGGVLRRDVVSVVEVAGLRARDRGARASAEVVVRECRGGGPRDRNELITGVPGEGLLGAVGRLTAVCVVGELRAPPAREAVGGVVGC